MDYLKMYKDKQQIVLRMNGSELNLVSSGGLMIRENELGSICKANI